VNSWKPPAEISSLDSKKMGTWLFSPAAPSPIPILSGLRIAAPREKVHTNWELKMTVIWLSMIELIKTYGHLALWTRDKDLIVWRCKMMEIWSITIKIVFRFGLLIPPISSFTNNLEFQFMDRKLGKVAKSLIKSDDEA